MSVINQVLNQLEERGVHAAPEQTMVRAVPAARRSYTLPLLAVVLALAGGIAAWQWIQTRKPEAAAVDAGRQQPITVAVSAQASAVGADVLGIIAESAVTPAETLPEILLPASRLSFELSSVPLPSSLREPKSSIEPGKVGEQAAENVTAKPQPVVRPATQQANGAVPMKQVSPAQRADAEFRKAVESMQQGHISEAIAGYETTLRLEAGHDAARQALAALLLESKRTADAERVLQEGLKVKPGHTGFAMLLARLQVERGAVEQAIATLEKSLPYADAQADYQAFFAALLQRQNRHKEAVTHYQIALRLAPNNGVWLMGYGISLQAAQRNDDAKDAFRRALDSKTLSPELQAFVRQKLGEF